MVKNYVCRLPVLVTAHIESDCGYSCKQLLCHKKAGHIRKRCCDSYLYRIFCSRD